jgi:uncharacterized protein involved in exopolysaccharide biosynthesis
MSSRSTERSGILAALVPIIRGWKFLFSFAVLGGLIAAGIILYRGPEYRASVSLVSVASSKSGSLSGVGGLAAAASLLGGASGGIGLQSSPALIVKFADLDGVLSRVAMAPYGHGTSQRIIERMADKSLTDIPVNRIPRIMRKYIHPSYDRTTGVIEVEVVHKDSALARTVLTLLLNETKSAFLQAVRSQATEMRESQERRVQVALSDMNRAEQAMQAFLSGNRQFERFSDASIGKSRLQREVDQAQEVYKGAVADMENARGKELEETPSVAVIDPMPTTLPRKEQHLGSISLVSALASALLAVLILLMRASFEKRVQERDPAALEVSAAFRRIPLIGRAFPEAPALAPFTAPEALTPTPRAPRAGTGTRG